MRSPRTAINPGPMFFQSDNAAPPCPEVLAAISAAADLADAAYDGDVLTRRLDAAFAATFGRECRVFPVLTGTAANALALATLVQPFGAIVCHREAHIEVDECGAPEFFTGGAKLMLVDGAHGLLTPAGISAGLAGHRGDVHQVQVQALSLTQATECGTAYSVAELAALTSLARGNGWRVHLDGARLGNAVAHLGCAPAAMAAGVDVLSFGAIKNGGMTAEAIVLFDLGLADQLAFRRKRAGQMVSKGRFQAAQLLAMLEGDVWLRNARAANAAAAEIASVVHDRLLHPVMANELFVQLHPGEPERLRAQGFQFYDWGAAGSNEARFVTHWATPAAHVAALAKALK